MAGEGVEDTERDRVRAKALFEYLYELSQVRSKTYKRIEDQRGWACYLDTLPKTEYVRLFAPWEVDDGTSGASQPLEDVVLAVSNPSQIPLCPQPSHVLHDWLAPGWDRPNGTAALQPPQWQMTLWQAGDTSEDDPKIPQEIQEEFDAWKLQRDSWAVHADALARSRDLYTALYDARTSLEKNSETLELVAGNGFAFAPGVNYPLFVRRMRIVFVPERGEICVCDTDTPSELDMRPINDLPGIQVSHTGEMEERFESRDINPLDSKASAPFLEALLQQLTPRGSFHRDGVPDNIWTGHDLQVYLRPVLLVRHRPDGTPKALKRICEAIEQGDEIPSHLLKIVSGGQVPVETDAGEPPLDRLLAEAGGEDPDILLSKQANREQLEIARRIDAHDAVLVQGPPGTGKTHTIANLLGNFLAQGKSVLVTSYTAKALSVVKAQLDPKVRDLCVMALDDTSDDMRRSVEGITRMTGENSSVSMMRKARETKGRRDACITELAEARRGLYQVLSLEHQPLEYEGQQMLPVEAAKWVHGNEEELGGLIPGQVRVGAGFPLDDGGLAALYRTNGLLTSEVEAELALGLPHSDELPSPDEVADACERLATEAAEEQRLEGETGWKLVTAGGELRARCPRCEVALPTGASDALAAEAERLSRLPELRPWMLRCAADARLGVGHRTPWKALVVQVGKAQEASDHLYEVGFARKVELGGASLQAARTTVEEASAVLARKGKIGRLDFLTRRALDRDVYDGIRLDGSPLRTPEDCDVVLSSIALDECRLECARLWDGLMAPKGEPAFADLDSLAPEQVAANSVSLIKSYLDWDGWRGRLVDKLAGLGVDFDALCTSGVYDSSVDAVERDYRVAQQDVPTLLGLAQLARVRTAAEGTLDAAVRTLAQGKRAGSNACTAAREAVEARDAQAYAAAFHHLGELTAREEAAESRRQTLERLRAFAPGWADAVERRLAPHEGSTPPDGLRDAWKLRQLSLQLDAMGTASTKELGRRCERLSAEYRRLTADLVSFLSWYHLIVRTEGDVGMRQALVGWQKTVQKIGKGTGRRAPQLRREARALMARCQRAVPAWIMTTQRALSTLDPQENRFDVVIVDEASQADVTSLAVAYMARKLVVVGDDKQVSPLAIGVRDDVRDKLADRYINGKVPNAHLYGADTSLYDIAATTFQPLMLREHFRCVPDIIGYSNALSYDNKIKPLREASSGGVFPAVVYECVDGERKEGSKVNLAEAEHVVALMAACLKMPEYAGKSFGAMSLLGEEQAELIQRLAVERIGVRPLEERRFLCGIPSNFQGDERDVIWLSLVDSPDEDGPIRLRGVGRQDSDKKRYNVAASRAKDQLWVVTSLDPKRDLKESDIRRGLLEYAINPHTQDRKAVEEDVRPETELVSALAAALEGRGYGVSRQWPVGAYRLDVVVTDGLHRAAIECDEGEARGVGDEVRAAMERQTILERTGWYFVRVRGSEYYRDPEGCVEAVCHELASLGVEPRGGEAAVASGAADLLERVREAARVAEGKPAIEPVTEDIPAKVEPKKPGRAELSQPDVAPVADDYPIEEVLSAAYGAGGSGQGDDERDASTITIDLVGDVAEPPRPARRTPSRKAMAHELRPRRMQPYKEAAYADKPMAEAQLLRSPVALSYEMERVIRAESPIELHYLEMRVCENLNIARLSNKIMLACAKALRNMPHAESNWCGRLYVWESRVYRRDFDAYRPNDDIVNRHSWEIPYEEYRAAMVDEVERVVECDKETLALRMLALLKVSDLGDESLKIARRAIDLAAEKGVVDLRQTDDGTDVVMMAKSG